MNNEHELFYLIKWCVAWISGAVSFIWGLNTSLDKYFSFRSKLLDKRIGELIDEKVDPQITKLSTSINELRDVIWELKNKM